MRVQSVTILAVLTLVSLGAAYFTWQRPVRVSKSSPQVVIMRTTRKSLEKVYFGDKTHSIEVSRRPEDASHLWVTLGTMLNKEKQPQPQQRLKPPTRTLRANARAEVLWKLFTPFKGIRALGVPSPEKASELGLTEDMGYALTFTVSGEARHFIASKSKPGLIGSYVLNKATGKAYLVSAYLFSQLVPTSMMLVDRRLHAFNRADCDSFALTVEGVRQEFLVKDASVTKKASPGKHEAALTKWYEKTWYGLIATELLGEGEVPHTGPPDIAARIDYFSQDTHLGWLEFATDSEGGIWARTENTASWMALHKTSAETDVLLELRQLFAAP